MLITLFSLVFTNNLLLSAVKQLRALQGNKKWLRAILFVLSAVGVVAGAAVTGDAIDFNQVTDLLKAAIEIAAVAIGSHYSYKAIKTA